MRLEYVLVPGGEEVRDETGEGVLGMAEERVMRALGKIRAGDYEPKLSAHACSYCPLIGASLVRSLCWPGLLSTATLPPRAHPLLPLTVVRCAFSRKKPTVEGLARVGYAALVANRALTALTLSEVRTALTAGDAEAAWEWLQTLPSPLRPLDLVAACSDARSLAAAAELDARSRAAASEGRWNRAEQLAAKAVSTMSTPWRQERLGLLRRRQPLQEDDRVLRAISAAVPATTRLTTDALMPEVDAVAACGAYHSRGAARSAP